MTNEERKAAIQEAFERMIEVELEVQRRRSEWFKAQEEQADAMREVLAKWQECVNETERTQANLNETIRSWHAGYQRLGMLQGL
jgi:K+/H+ antiporter YhaU regulatory subunit KhtT